MTQKKTIALLSILLASACSRSRTASEPALVHLDRVAQERAAVVAGAVAAAEGAPSVAFVADGSAPHRKVAVAPGTSGGAEPADVAAAAARKIIRTASLTIDVEDAAHAAQRIEDLAESRGGYVSGLQGGTEGGRSSAVTIRVPHEQFASAIRGIRSLGIVQAEHLTTQDVGREYADVEARLDTKRAVAARMREILSTRTASLQDLFEAERQLASVLGEIEQLEGQRRFFDHQVSLCTITATVREPRANVTTVATSAPELPPFLQPAREALLVARGHLSQLFGFATYAAVVGAPWVALALVLWLVAKRMGRRAGAAA